MPTFLDVFQHAPTYSNASWHIPAYPVYQCIPAYFVDDVHTHIHAYIHTNINTKFSKIRRVLFTDT